MRMVEKITDEVAQQLAHTQRALKRLASCTDDRTARLLLELQFDHLRDRVASFATHSLGVSFPGHDARNGEKLR